MMTPKQALIKDGTIPVKEGRGRLSREGIARCMELAASGWDIAGYEVNRKASASISAPVVKKVAPVTEKVILDFTLTYPMESFRAIDQNGKAVGMAEACNNCRVSLVQCNCGAPTVVGDRIVKILKK